MNIHWFSTWKVDHWISFLPIIHLSMISLDTRHVDPVKAPLQLPLLLLQNHLLHLPGLGFKICQNRAAVGGAVPTKWQPYTTIKNFNQSSHLRVQLKSCALSNQWDTRKCPCGICWAFEPGLASPLSAASSLAICLHIHSEQRNSGAKTPGSTLAHLSPCHPQALPRMSWGILKRSYTHAEWVPEPRGLASKFWSSAPTSRS